MNKNIKQQNTLVKTIDGIIRNKTFIHIFLFLFIFLGLTFFTCVNFFPSSVIKVGEVAPKDIIAPKTVEIINIEKTNQKKLEASGKIGIIYSLDPYILSSQQEKITQIFNDIRKIYAYEKLGDTKKAQKIRSKLSSETDESLINNLIKIDPYYLNKVETFSKYLLIKAMKNGVKKEDIPKAKEFIDTSLENTSLDQNLKNCIAELLSSLLTPNIIPNTEEIKRAQQKKMDEVEPVKSLYKKGQLIIRQGEIFTPADIEALKLMNLYSPSLDIFGIIGAALFSILFIIVILSFISKHCPRILFDDKLLLLLSLIILLVVGVSKGLIVISNYIAPVAAASILIAVLLDWKLAILVTILLSVQVGIFTNSIMVICVSLVSGIVGILSSAKINKRWDLFMSGLAIIFANCVILLIIGLIQGMPIDHLLKEELFMGGIINGSIAAIFAVGMLPFFENTFNITTHIKLIELSSPNEPILNKLLVEAPGTYHHSIIVGNLAYSAAQVVRANPLLARVGAYYHDIGKIKRPYFFVENQLKNDNPHDKISPTLSTLIIISHVKDGIELAQKYRLPEVLINFIKEHHGTSLVAYFYHEALARASEEEKNDIAEEDFRYTGPKPQSKEAAIVMLADIIEASSRTLDTVNQVKISNLVKQVIKSALDDGQLDESQLSFKNLKDISASFVRTLSGMYHSRIEYPEKLNTAKKETRSPKNGKEKTAD